jgi:tRNA(fMet)-specific endonuclease VapC
MITRLLDTNKVSYVVKGQPPMVRARLARIPPAEIAVSAVTEAELRYGLARDPGAPRLHPSAEISGARQRPRLGFRGGEG